MDERENIIGKVKEYKKLVDKEFPVKIEQFYLFGSYAKGNFHQDSDIDVALVVPHLEDNYDSWKTTPLLWHLRWNIDLRIEPHLIARDDDFIGFVKEIERTGIEITT
jgi:predicted nucleotidyltransferase